MGRQEPYSDFIAAEDLHAFEFMSSGKKGDIRKIVAFTPTALKDVYNLVFGDGDEPGNINDDSVSNNGDRNKILATVARIVEIYINRYPERWVYFRGSTEERTRLYRMAIGLNLEELSAKFEIYAENRDGEYELFHKNMALSGFLIKSKNA